MLLIILSLLGVVLATLALRNPAPNAEEEDRVSRRNIRRELHEIQLHRPDHIIDYQQEEQ